MPRLINRRLTQKQETFCIKYFELGNASEAARIALYSPKTAAVIGRENLLKPKIQARIDQLRQIVEDESVANVLERKQILTEIARGRFTHFIDTKGNLVELTEENLKSAALQEVRITQFTGGKDGRASEKTTTIKLNSPIQAIDLLNKMEKIYAAEPSVVIDNRTLNINVISEKAKTLTQRIIEGERTGGDDNH